MAEDCAYNPLTYDTRPYNPSYYPCEMEQSYSEFPDVSSSLSISTSYPQFHDRASLCNAIALELEIEPSIIFETDTFRKLSNSCLTCCVQIIEEKRSLRIKNIDMNLWTKTESRNWHASMEQRLQFFDNFRDLQKYDFQILNRIYGTQIAQIIFQNLTAWRNTASILKEIQTEADQHCSSISSDESIECFNNDAELLYLSNTDPHKWSEADCKKWVHWMLHKYRFECDEDVKNFSTDRNYKQIFLQNKSLFEFQSIFGSILGESVFKEYQHWLTYTNNHGNMPKSKDPNKKVRKPRVSRTGLYLWQKILQLLMNPDEYGHCIKWLKESTGEFEITNSSEVSRIWGDTKRNDGMNYEKLSRSLRQYYNKDLLSKSGNRRLVYKFNLENEEVVSFMTRTKLEL